MYTSITPSTFTAHSTYTAKRPTRARVAQLVTAVLATLPAVQVRPVLRVGASPAVRRHALGQAYLARYQARSESRLARAMRVPQGWAMAG